MYRQQYPDDPGQHNTFDAARHSALPNSYHQYRYVHRYTISQCIRANMTAFIIGTIFLLASSALILWNESRAVQTERSLQEGLKDLYELSTNEVAFVENNGKLVYVTGDLWTNNPVSDDTYNIEVFAVHLKRQVEMYQWIERESVSSHDEGDTAYSYNEEWRSEWIDSRSFARSYHKNPDSISISAMSYTTEDVHVGNFQLSADLLSTVGTNHRYTALRIPGTVDAHLVDGMFYHGKDASYPEVGDIRVWFEFGGPCSASIHEKNDDNIVSIIAKQNGNVLQSYQTSAGDEIAILGEGLHTPKKLFGQKQMENVLQTWAIRFGGWLVGFIGFACISNIVVLIDNGRLPIVRELAGLSLHTMNAVLSIILSITCTALAWVFLRPMFAGLMIFLACVPILLSVVRRRWGRTRVD